MELSTLGVPGVVRWEPPPRFEEQELEILALELWQRASCPEEIADEWMSDAEAMRSHASCL